MAFDKRALSVGVPSYPETPAGMLRFDLACFGDEVGIKRAVTSERAVS
jgi:hypothetical protein